MSLKQSQKVETNRYELEVLIDADSFQKAIETAYQKNRSKMNVPGFRKGKAPRGIIERYYGEQVFYEDALNLLYSDAVDEAVEKAGLELADQHMDFDLVSIDAKTGVDFKVTVTTKPEVTLENYKGIAVERVKPAVTDQEIEDELGRMADRNARMVTVEDRAAQNGDIVVIDFEGFVDDKPFEGGKGESYSLTLGAGQFIPGFEEQIVGHSTEDAFSVNVAFPDDYHAEELAGKPAVFQVKLHEIKQRELPAVDDEFAKDVSEFDTLDALKADLKEKALHRKEHEADDDVERQLLEALVASMKAEIPEVMVERRIDQNVQDFGYRLQMQGLTLDKYLEFTGSDATSMREGFKEQAERQVKIRLALEKVAKLEALEPSEEEIEKEYEKLAKEYGVELDKVKTAIQEKDIVKDLAVSKAVQWLKDQAVVKEVDKKAPPKTQKEKKPAAKKKSPAKTEEKSEA